MLERLLQPVKSRAVILAGDLLRRVPSPMARRVLADRLSKTGFFTGDYAHPFEVTTPFGVRFTGNTRDVIQAHLFAFGRWSPHISSWLSARLRPGDTFVDVGANIGYFTLLGSKLVGPAGRVVAVEAHPDIYASLSRHVAMNGATNVRAVNLAASSEEGSIKIYRGPEWNSGMSSTVPPELWKRWVDDNRGKGGIADGLDVSFTSSVDVKARPLDEILDEKEISSARLIKIDVEGAELHVVRGMRRLLARAPESLEVILEVNPGLLQAMGASVDDVLEPFLSNGFSPFILEEAPLDAYLSGVVTGRPKRLEGSASVLADVIFSKSRAQTL